MGFCTESAKITQHQLRTEWYQYGCVLRQYHEFQYIHRRAIQTKEHMIHTDVAYSDR